MLIVVRGVVLLFIAFLVACAKPEPPECHSVEIIGKVRQGIDESLQKFVGSSVNVKDYFSTELKYMVLKSYDKETQKRSCGANLTITIKQDSIDRANNAMNNLGGPSPVAGLAILMQPKLKELYAAFEAMNWKKIESNIIASSIDFTIQFQSGSKDQYVIAWDPHLTDGDNAILYAAALVSRIANEAAKDASKSSEAGQSSKEVDSQNSNVSNESQARLEVMISEFAICEGSGEAVCLTTNMGKFTANGNALSEAELNILSNSAGNKQSVCLKAVDRINASLQMFESVSHKCS